MQLIGWNKRRSKKTHESNYSTYISILSIADIQFGWCAVDNRTVNPNTFLYLGAENWIHPAWTQGFYPEGVPDDWLLSYYNTQFKSVFLPASVWQLATHDDWINWLKDTQEDFVFVVENSNEKPPIASGRVVEASPAWLADHVWWLDARPDMRALAQCIAAHAVSGDPLFVISRAGDLDRLRQVEALREVMGY